VIDFHGDALIPNGCTNRPLSLRVVRKERRRLLGAQIEGRRLDGDVVLKSELPIHDLPREGRRSHRGVSVGQSQHAKPAGVKLQDAGRTADVTVGRFDGVEQVAGFGQYRNGIAL
jgi:hypothetical protein